MALGSPVPGAFQRGLAFRAGIVGCGDGQPAEQVAVGLALGFEPPQPGLLFQGLDGRADVVLSEVGVHGYVGDGGPAPPAAVGDGSGDFLLPVGQPGDELGQQHPVGGRQFGKAFSATGVNAVLIEVDAGPESGAGGVNDVNERELDSNGGWCGFLDWHRARASDSFSPFTRRR